MADASLQQEARDALARTNAAVEAIVNALKAEKRPTDEEIAGFLTEIGIGGFNAIVYSLLTIADRVDVLASILER